MVPEGGALPGPDGRLRCPWGCPRRRTTPRTTTTDGARAVHGDDALFERLCLEGFQSGLSWLTILRKREAFRAAFAGFHIPDGREVHRGRRASACSPTAASSATALKIQRHAQQRPGGGRVGAGQAGPPGVVLRPRPTARPVPRTMHELPADHPRVHGAGQGPQEARLPLRRPHHRLRPHTGVRPGQRPPGRLLAPRRRRAGKREGRREHGRPKRPRLGRTPRVSGR